MMKNGFTTSENWNIGKINYIMDTLYKHLIYLRNNFNLEDSTTIIKRKDLLGLYLIQDVASYVNNWKKWYYLVQEN